jgi:HEPN domain-containing protein
MSKVGLDQARMVTSSIVDALDPQSVIVFGSVGRTGEGNDLDILIVLDRIDGSAAVQPNLKLRSVLKKHLAQFAIDPFIISSSDFSRHFRKGSPFLKAIIRDGRHLYMKNAESEWLRDAQEELKTAEYLFQGGFWKTSCYHAKQSVEKCMKARLLGKGWELEKVHSIARVVALASQYGLNPALDDDDVEYIDSIYRGRYPGEAGLLPLGEPQQRDAERAIAISRRLLVRE